MHENETHSFATSAASISAKLTGIVKAISSAPRRFYRAEEGRFLLWVPVVLAFGVASYFALPFEPDNSFAAVVFCSGLLLSLFCGYGIKSRTFALVIFLVATGFTLAKARTEFVRAPVLTGKGGYYEVEGQLHQLTPLPGEQYRLIITDVTLKRGVKVLRLKRIRLSSRMREPFLLAGSRIRLKSVLRPPPDPIRPDGFDFARMAWYQQLGAVGYAVSKSEVVAPAYENDWRMQLERMRKGIYDNIVEAAPGVGGDIAVALILGERKRLEPEVLEAIRTAGLAHMLAISGMHMVLVSGAIYWLIRALFAASEMLALRYDLRKVAALGAIVAAGAYYLISGMGIATLRAFIMTTIALTAILLGRTALSLRNVAFASLLILIAMPESLLDVSFQMSFAAVIALVATYEFFSSSARTVRNRSTLGWLLRKVAFGFISIFLTTLIAGIAVLPFATYHFHHLSTYSLVGNLLAMPVLSFFVMPMGLVGVLLMPFGLSKLPLNLMGEGTQTILAIAKWVASLDNARVEIGEIGFIGLIVMVLGGLWLCLWHSRWRLLGVPAVVLGIASSQWIEQPTLLIDREGKNVVLIDDKNRMWASRPGEAEYSVRKWSDSYAVMLGGDDEGNGASPWLCDEQGCAAKYQEKTVIYSFHPGSLDEDCRRANILIAVYPVYRDVAACRSVSKVIDIRDLNRLGAHAIYISKNGLKIITSANVRGNRPWSSQ